MPLVSKRKRYLQNVGKKLAQRKIDKWKESKLQSDSRVCEHEQTSQVESAVCTDEHVDAEQESTVILRKKLTEKRIGEPSEVEHNNFILSLEDMEDIASVMKCSCGGEGLLSYTRLGFDCSYSFNCENEWCEKQILEKNKSVLKVEGIPTKVGKNTLSAVAFGMQYDIGIQGMRDLASSIGLPMMSRNMYRRYELALKKGVSSDALKQVKGADASGSLKIAEPAAKKAAAKKAATKKPAAIKAATKKPAKK